MRSSTTVAVLLAACAAGASASSLIPSVSATGEQCGIAPTPGVPFNIYTLGVLFGDAAAGGITGAEYKLQGQDVGWIAVVTANPAANLVLGSPVQNGCNIAFPACQTGAGPRTAVLLHTIQFISFGPVAPTVLETTRHDTPSNANFRCPLFTLCDAPVFTLVCMAGGQECVNVEGPCCVRPVAGATWTSVKSLYGWGGSR